jgi:UDP-2,3-diacylglucosamine hydrolase
MTSEPAGAAGPGGRDADTPRLGILAGAGILPIEVARAALATDRRPHIVAIEGFAGPDVASFSHEWVNLGQVGRILASLRRNGCRDLVIAGALERPNLWRLRFDWGALRRLSVLLSLTRGGDDSVLRRVVRFFEAEGLRVRGVGEIAPDLLARAGVATAVGPTEAQAAMIDRAARLIMALGPFDVGQAVVAGPSGIVAVEGVRGTDAMLRDLGSGGIGAGKGSNGVLVKLAKPDQELRVDLPTIGAGTIEAAKGADLKGVAVGAGAAIVLERARLLERANADGLFVVGLGPTTRDGAAKASATTQATAHEALLAVVARRAPTPADRRDVAVARRLVPVLRVHGAGRAAVIVREHVLAIAGALDAHRVVAGLGRNASWGRRALKGQIGILVIDIAGAPGATIAVDALPAIDDFRAMVAAGLAGLVLLGGPIPQAHRADIIGWANDARVFLMAEEAAPDGA